ncbi:uroporphyrinogen-III synthase [Acetobacter sp.]|jgi:uroporphyrinogen-III synthase|uniref:uroporphyrinogen-III synthase n=1 Tax=Acetobacter sp. TaxID=440 RepID=UPI0025C55352|nr:uroporphyrinogen-III synthase [Acetobacter sp.]MCH4091045.1 uroporphyrinogen-III synthase [Acetobacter sp.]MCI1300228.1 uroporphyrinogen-III synthase [Acetobacter sp.]MCI1316104.1 uroporphyrinogen-III synthase [Acetobacter sp.]
MNKDTPSLRGVLVVRPEPGLTDTCETLERLGWRCWGMESLVITARPLPPQRGIAGALITSSQSILALSSSATHDIPVYAVGDATAERVKRQGFQTVISASGDAMKLAELVTQQLSPASGPLLLLSGEHQGLPLAKTLRDIGFRIRRRIAYATSPATALPPEVLSALREGLIATVLVFSAASARAFCATLARADCSPGTLRAIAISQNTMKELRKGGFQNIMTARTPDMAAMLDRLESAASPPSC